MENQHYLFIYFPDINQEYNLLNFHSAKWTIVCTSNFKSTTLYEPKL